MGRIALILLAAAILAAANSPAPSGGQAKNNSQQQQQSGGSAQPSAPDQRGTDQMPLSVKVIPAPKTQAEADQEAAERQNKESADWWMVKLTAALVGVGILQLAVFVLQLFVFGLQARRLKETIKKMDEIATGQTTDMQASIKEASRAAEAMGRIADGIAEQVTNTATLMRTQREFWQKQMRAYVYPIIGGAVFQESARKLRFEAKPSMVNFGSTPAHNVRYSARAAIMPIPIPVDFDYPLTEEVGGGGALLGPRADFIMNAVVDDYVPDQDVEVIKQGDGRALVTWGTIEYTLVTGEDVHTNFCQIYTWRPDGKILGVYTRTHNDAT